MPLDPNVQCGNVLAFNRAEIPDRVIFEKIDRIIDGYSSSLCRKLFHRLGVSWAGSCL